ncbi:glycosyl hydrolase family 28-related protein [Pseudomonas sp. PS01302]|uniref:glycosyl hydrolase family 28-related protein n=1 Tax=Pseudomonas sp. PS01302 TaxID=2991438 RepID=UPI00249C9116|nr:glycosyl hydrolase family 28-related protein [Pseudomonas sp. PS01302]
MTDQAQRLEIATVRAEIGSNITYKFNNDALDAPEIPTDSGPIPNLKQVIRDIKEEALDETLRAELFAAAGAGMVGFDPAQMYPANTVGSAILYNRRKTVKTFGAVGDGIANDTVAIKAAISAAGPYGVVIFDEASEYLVTETIVQPTGQQWIGQGGQRSARLKKGFNGDLVVMGSLGAISDLTLNNNGANFTGRGIYVPSGFSQTIYRVRSVQSKGPSLEFAQDAGGGCNVFTFEGDTTDQGSVGAIKISGDAGPHPRMFNGIWLSGGFIDLAGPGAGNGCSFSNFYIRNIKTLGPAVGGTALCHFVNGRVASISDTTVLSGSDITMASVAFSGAVILDNMQGFKAEACTFGAGITETSTSRFNSYSDQVKTFSPTWSQSTGPQPSIGNGSLTGKYTRQGYLVKFEMSLTVGSTTTFGNSASAWSFSLPVSGTQNSPQDFIAGQCFDASASTDFLVNGQIVAGANSMTISRNGAGVRDGFPFAWGVGDTIKLSICYMSI